MPLTDVAIRRAAPQSKPYKLFDSSGLFVLINPAGGKWWRFKYRFDGKEKLLSLGTYPEVTLVDARKRRDAERRKLADKIDPSVARKMEKTSWIEKQGNNFEDIAREWIDIKSANWSDSNTKKITRRLELDVFPWLGPKAISEISPPQLLAVLRRTESRGAIDTAHRALQTCRQIFCYAIATGRAERNPATDLGGALQSVKGSHFPAVTEPKAVGALLRTLDGYQGSVVIRCALRLAPLVFLRPGELRKAEWTEIDFDTSQWLIPAARMKMKQPHIVPLSRQAVETLKDLRPLTGSGRYLFPSPRSKDRPMSDNAVLSALRAMGIGKEIMCGHGFRAMARTLLDEVLHVRIDFIEHQLAHAVRDPNGRAYNRTAHFEQRRKMMQRWSDYLDTLRRSTAK
jgi:integrase